MSIDSVRLEPLPPDDTDLRAAVAALIALSKHNIPPDVQELLIYGNPDRKIRPGAFRAAMQAALLVYNPNTK